MQNQYIELNNFRKDISNYYQSPRGNTEKIISVKPVEIESIPILSKHLLSNYKLSNFWKGLRPIKRLTKKIFEEKLKTQIIWKSDIWNKIIIIPTKCEIKDAKTNQYFSELKPQNINDISEDFAKNISKRRERSIEKSAMKLKNNIDLGSPLYLSGGVLNYLGANVDSKEIFMVDGARRIVASALNHQKYIKILLMMLMSEFQNTDTLKV